MTQIDHFIWKPSKYMTLFGDFGIEMYVIMTYTALAFGLVGWWWFTRKLPVSQLQRWIGLGIFGVVAVLFTRLFHIVFWGWEQTVSHPRLWVQLESGRSIHGALFGFAISSLIVGRWWRTSVSNLSEFSSIWALFGLICARIGNFWNSEMIGTPSDGPFAIGFYYTGDRGLIPRHPTQLYEAFGALLIICLIFATRKRLSQKPFASAGITLVGYGIIRFLCDAIKEEPGHLLGPLLTTGQWLSLALLTAGISLWIRFPQKTSAT